MASRWSGAGSSYPRLVSAWSSSGRSASPPKPPASSDGCSLMISYDPSRCRSPAAPSRRKWTHRNPPPRTSDQLSTKVRRWWSLGRRRGGSVEGRQPVDARRVRRLAVLGQVVVAAPGTPPDQEVTVALVAHQWHGVTAGVADPMHG